MKMTIRTYVAVVAQAFALTCLADGPVLTGNTTNPTNGCFAIGRPVGLVLEAKGLAANERRALTLGVYDAWNRRVSEVKGEIAADAQGTWKGTFAIPNDRYGFYRVRVDEAGGLAFPKVGTRPANCITYAVLADPATRPLLSQEDAFYGIHGEAIGTMPWLGVRQKMGGLDPRTYAKREQASWRVYGFLVCSRLSPWEYLLGCFDKDFAKNVISAKKIGMNYALTKEPGGAEQLRAAMTKFATDVQKGWPKDLTSRIYEIFWEPDLGISSPEHLVEVAKIAYEAIHSVDREAVVLSPTFSHMQSVSMLRKCMDAGLGKYMDAFGLHAYNGFPPEQNGFLTALRRMKAILREYLGRDIPMIGTENGYLAVATQEEEYLQMTGHVRAQLILQGEGFWFNCPFYGYDHHIGCKGDYGLTYNLDMRPDRLAWGPTHVSPRPSFVPLSAASLLLDGYRPTCTVEWLGETVLGYAYQSKAGDCRIALWDFGGTSEVTIPVGRETLELADMMGNRRTVRTAKGDLKLTLNAEPVYVIDVDPAIWGKAAQAKLKWSGRKFRRADADAPLQIVGIAPSYAAGRAGVAVTVENITDAPVEGEVETRLKGVPEARQAVPVKVAAGRTAVVRTAMDEGFRPPAYAFSEIAVTVAPKKGPAVKKSANLNFLPVRRTADGKDIVEAKVPATKGRNGYAITGDDDCSVSAGFGWNEKFLYFAFTVTDDEFSNVRTGVMSWQGDSIQLGLAKDPFVKPSPNSYADDLNRALTEMTLALTPNGPEVCRTMTFDENILPCGRNGVVDPKECPLEVTNEKTAKGVRTHYRVAVPWKYLNVSGPKAGDVVWFAAMVNDQDADTMQSELKSCSIDVFNLKQAMPKKFGALTLCAD